MPGDLGGTHALCPGRLFCCTAPLSKNLRFRQGPGTLDRPTEICRFPLSETLAEIKVWNLILT
jgi:hypothetical protein